jgi:ZIP family zinc transporter
MVASGNIGLAFGLTCAAGACTTLGACIVFCAHLANAKFLAGALGFSAGVMLYVSFAEIFLRKSVDGFEEANFSDVEAYRYSTLAFFGGFLVIFILDKIVHLIMHLIEKRSRKNERIMPSATSKTVLLAEELEAGPSTKNKNEKESLDDTETQNVEDLESQNVPDTENKSHIMRIDHVAPIPPSMSTSRSVATGCESPRKVVTSELDPDEDCSDEDRDDQAQEEDRTSRQAPDVVNLISQDPHSVALHRMGLLTGLAIFIHNFPEGLATFVAALSDTSVGIGIAIAIAVHNIPEGICVALPIYYSTGSKAKAFFWATASGMSEPLGALVGYFALYGDTSLAFAIVFALVAGMMVYIAIKELIPMGLRYDPKDSVTTNCVILGMVVMAASLLLFTL